MRGVVLRRTLLAILALGAVFASGVLIAGAAPRAAKPKQMKYACAAGQTGALRYTARPRCRSGERLIRLRRSAPIDACVKLHGTWQGVRGNLGQLKVTAAQRRRLRRLPAGTTRVVDSASECAPHFQPNEVAIRLPGAKRQWFCALRERGTLVQWASRRSRCNSDATPVYVRQGNRSVDTPNNGNPNQPAKRVPRANPDAATTDEDSAQTINVRANDFDPDRDPFRVHSFNTTGTKGRVSLNPNGTVRYDPNGALEDLGAGQSRTDRFSYRLVDRDGVSSPATVSVRVTGENDAPVVSGVETTVLSYFEGSPAAPVSPGLTLADVDSPNLESATVEIASGRDAADRLDFTPQSGISGTYDAGTGLLTLTGSATRAEYQAALRSVAFRSNNGPFGDRVVEFQANDGAEGSNTPSRTVKVDQKPTAVDDSRTVGEDSGATNFDDLLANDTDPDNGPKSIESVSTPAKGTATVTGGGSGVSYTPNANYCGNDSFTYTLNGGSSATVTITVTCSNDAPVAVDDSATVAEDAPAGAIDVLANDTDAENDARTITSAADPASGTVVLTGGSAGAHTGLTYQPDPDFCGSDSFTYELNGGDTATVAVTVTCVDDNPRVNAASAALDYDENDGAVAVDSGVDVDHPDTGATIASASAKITTGYASGQDRLRWTDNTMGDNIALDLASTDDEVRLTGSGTPAQYAAALQAVTYENTSEQPSAAARQVTFTTVDGKGATGSDTRDVAVNPVDDAPVAVDDTDTVAEDSSGNAINVLGNDTDIDAGPMTVASVTQPANGSVAITGGGTGVSYTPAANACGSDTFDYTLNGGDTGTVTITVTCNDDLPTAVNDTATVGEDSGATAVDVLANDTDPDTGTKTIGSVSQPGNGTVVITGGGTGLTYEPAANYCNSQPAGTPDTFTYTLAEGGSTATVSVTVDCADDAPTAVDDSATVNEDSGANTVDVLANDTDIDGGPLTVDSVTQPSGGTVTITNSGADVSFEPNANFCGATSFDYTVNGGDTATVSVTVTCVDDPPAATDDAATVGEDSAATPIDVLGNDTDGGDGGPLAIASSDDPANGAVVLTGGTPGAHTGLTYQPDANFCGTDTFDYTLNGGDKGTVTVTVTCVPEPPTVDLTDAALGYSENDGAQPVDAAADVDDPDGVTLDEATVELTANYQAGEDFLEYADTNPGDNITVDATNTASSVRLYGVASADAYEAAIRQVTYRNSSENPSALQRTVTVTVSDASNQTASDTRGITVAPVDDAPAAVNDAGTLDEDASATTIDVLANDTDIDGGPKTIASATDPARGTVTVTGGGTGLTYKPDANYCNDPGAEPEDTFTYTLNGGSSATVSMTVTCINDAPVADDEVYTGAAGAVGNTALILDAVGDDNTEFDPSGPEKSYDLPADKGPLHFDTDIDGPGPIEVVSAGTDGANGLTDRGGTIAIQRDGDLLYIPPAGCSTTPDKFRYVITDSHPTQPGLDEGEITIHTARCVWYVQDGAPAGGDGRSHKPYEDVTPLNNSGSDPDAANHEIFLYGGSYSGLTLENGQNLLSDRHGLEYNDGGFVYTLNAQNTNDPRSQLNGGLVLGQNNYVQGVDLGNHSGFALSNTAGSAVSNGGTAQVNNGTSGRLNNSNGGGVSIASGGTVDIQFTDAFITSGGTHGINLQGVNGDFRAGQPGNSIQNATMTAVNLDDGNVKFRLDSNISDDNNGLVSIANQDAGPADNPRLKDFNGSITDGSGSNAAAGISLSNNASTLTRFDGPVTLSTGSGPGIAANNGGTLAMPDPAGSPVHTVATTTGTPLNMASTTIHDDDLVFGRIDAIDPAGAGISLSNTTNPNGRLVVGPAATGTACSGGGCNGGTINGAGAPAIALTNVPSGADITRMALTNGASDGISVDNVDNGLSVVESQIATNGDGTDESGLDFNEVNGTVTLTRNTVTDNFDFGARINNTSGTVNATVTGGTYSGAKQNDGIQLRTPSAATGVHTLNVQSATLGNNHSDHVQVSNDSTATPAAQTNVTVNNSTMTANPSVDLGGGIDVRGTANADINATLTNNTITTAKGSGMNLVLLNGTGDLDATVDNNDIRSTVANGILVEASTVGTTDVNDVRAVITNNEITGSPAGTATGYNANGIEIFQHRNTNVSATLRGNLIQDPRGTALNGIRAQAGETGSSDTGTLCLDAGSTSDFSQKNAIAGSGVSAAGQQDIRLAQRGNTTFRLPGYAGANNNTGAVASYLQARNDRNGTPTALATFNAGPGYVNSGSCPQP